MRSMNARAGYFGPAVLDTLLVFSPFILTRTEAILEDFIAELNNRVLLDLEPHEAAFVRDQRALGKIVEIIPRSSDRTPDFRIDGKLFELKTIYGVKDATADRISGAIANRVMNRRGQAPDIIVNARWQKGITEDIAARGIRRAYGADNLKGAKIQSIRVIGPDFDFTVNRNND